ncbi:hypothetical protein [Streptomyces sp. uw30]|uniref:hypothetical protein n=1 Tax=Streptomyces sp. uw30 TaxID=1828179 RepID=UPI0011CE888B|nr:hypothetical protein [Streptomyces sp. uw30]
MTVSNQPTRAEVLDAYRSLPPRQGEPAADLSRDVIACGDESVREAALALGRDLGRPVVDVDVASGWLSQTPTPAPTSVLLMAGRHTLVAETVREWVTSATRHEVPVGFVLAADPAEAEFQASKITLGHARVPAGADVLIDAVNGVCGPPDDLKVARPERLGAILDAPWRLLAISGHSDLGHMGLGSLVLCGATGPERVDGRLLSDGCDPSVDHCRCTTKLLRTAVPTVGLRAAVVALMGCGSFDLAVGEHPTTNSMCASALNGWALAAVGTLGQFNADFDAVGVLAAHVAEGLSLGEAVQRLNRAHRIPTGYGVALAGDPALRFPARTPARLADSGAAVVGDDAGDRLQTPDEALDLYQVMIARSRTVERARHALQAVAENGLDEDLEDSLERLGRGCEQVQSAAWDGIGRIRGASDMETWRMSDGVTARLERAVRRWDEAFAATAMLAVGNDVYAALHTFLRLDDARAEGACARCGSRIQVFEYDDPDSAGGQRVAAECWLCGPMRESAGTGPVLAITASGLHAPGDVVRPALSVRGTSGEPDGTGHLAVILNDRVTDRVLATFHAECTLADLPEPMLTIPEDTHSDLHVLWAVWVGQVTVTFAGTRLGVVRTVEQA